MKYDTLIIGAGMSGLAAGIRMAYYEKPVCILERHTTIGGLNSFYRLRGFNHDVGLHAVTNWRPPGTKRGPLSKLLRQLRLRWEDFELAPQVGSSICFPGAQLRFGNGLEVLEASIADRFPSQIDGFRRLAARLSEIGPADIEASRLSGRQTLREYLDDPLLVEMLVCPVLYYGSATPRDCDLRQFAIMFNAIFAEGFGRPHRGIRPIIKAVTRQYKALGGQLRLRAGVKRLLHDGRRICGVELDDGEVLEAENILSSAGSAETAGLLAGPEVDWPGGAPQSGALSFVESISILDAQPSELGMDETIIFFSNQSRFRYERPDTPVDLQSGIICSPNNYRYEKPLAEGRLRMTALADSRFWFGLPESDYVAAKERAFEEMTAAAGSLLPADLQARTIDHDFFTPRTITRFTGHFNGCIYGAPRKWPEGQTPLENLYLCGTDQGYLGIVGAMLSGVSIVNRHLLR